MGNEDSNILEKFDSKLPSVIFVFFFLKTRNSIPPTTTLANFHEKLQEATGKCFVDTAFWGGVIPGNQVQWNSLDWMNTFSARLCWILKGKHKQQMCPYSWNFGPWSRLEWLASSVSSSTAGWRSSPMWLTVTCTQPWSSCRAQEVSCWWVTVRSILQSIWLLYLHVRTKHSDWNAFCFDSCSFMQRGMFSRQRRRMAVRRILTAIKQNQMWWWYFEILQYIETTKNCNWKL